jgi:cytochrome c oxidase subunit 2
LLLSAAACARGDGVSTARGRQIYATCAACHGTKGQGSRKIGAPNIAGLPKWYIARELEKFIAGRRGFDSADTVGRTMSVVSTTIDGDDDLESVADYISNLPHQPAEPTIQGDTAEGKIEYQACAACHADDGKGRESATQGSVPPVAGLADWYVAAQIEAFKKGWRGVTATDLPAEKMRAVVIPLDSAAIANVTAYIRTLG